MIKAPILGKKLAFVIAHPDDESYLAAGTIHRNRQDGGQSIVICATAGERGKAHLDKPVTEPTLKKIRQQELEAVGELLQLESLIQLGLPDGEVGDHRTELSALVKQHLSQTDLDYVISFAADGVTGHQDHITVGMAARQAAQNLAVPFVVFCRPSQLRLDILKQRRRFGTYQEDITHQEPNFSVTIDPKVKWACLCRHVSQMDQEPLADFPDATKQQLLHHEYFYAAWLKQSPGKNQS